MGIVFVYTVLYRVVTQRMLFVWNITLDDQQWFVNWCFWVDAQVPWYWEDLNLICFPFLWELGSVFKKWSGGVCEFPRIFLMSGSKLWVFHLQYWVEGGGWAMGSLSFTGRILLDPCYTKDKFSDLTPVLSHFLVPGNAGKSYDSSQNKIFSSHVAFTLDFNMSF